MQLTAVYIAVPEGYVAFIEELPGANTQGDTLEEARENLREILWGGSWKPVMVWAVGDVPLLGMQQMLGCKLEIDVVPGGSVEILPLR